MKKIFVLLVLINTFIYAQTAPAIEWQNTIGGNTEDYLYSLQETNDGGYILAGFSTSGISGDKTESTNGGPDIWILKLNSSGSIQWQNTIGGSLDERPYSIKQTGDGGYIVGAYSNSGISGDKTEASQGSYDYWILKLDANGNIQWQNTIGGNSADYLSSLELTSDGGYIVSGYSFSGMGGDKTENSQGAYDFWIVKLNSAGNIQWQNTIGGSNYDEFCTIQQTSDGGYILGGHTNSGISGDKTEASMGSVDYWVLKLNSTGSIQWQNTIGGSFSDALYLVQEVNDGGYILAGTSNSNISGDKTEPSQGGEDYWVVKLNSAGNIQWQNTIGGAQDDRLRYMDQTVDSGYILAGHSYSGATGDKTEASQGDRDYWVVKINNSGTIQWQDNIGGNDQEELFSIQQTTDGGFLFGGMSGSGITGDKTEPLLGWVDYWVIKMGPECTNPIIASFIIDSNQVCLGDSVTLTITGSLNDAEHWSIYDGSCNGTFIDSTSANSITVVPSGSTTYFVRGEGGCVTGATCSSVSVAVDPLPTVSAGLDSVICNGDTVEINATGAVSYSWNNGIGNINPALVAPSGTTIYSVVGTDGNGCVNSDSLVITVNPLPNTFAGNDTLICPGSSAVLNASGADNYLWIGLSTTNPQVVSPFTTDTFAVAGYSPEGCAQNDTIIVEVSTLPVLNFILGLDTVCTSYAPLNLNASPVGGDFGGAGVSGIQFQPLLAGAGLHTITYTFINNDGCSTDTTELIFVSPCLSIEDEDLANISFYPNPFTDKLHVQSVKEIIRIEMMDITGKKIISAEPKISNLSIDLDYLSPGVYVVSVTTDSGVRSTRVVKR